MKKYVCLDCGYIYDEEKGVTGKAAPNYNALLKSGCSWHKNAAPRANIPECTAWEDIPASFTCPSCGAEKNNFELL